MAYIDEYNKIKDFVLKQNPYFDNGFANVFKDKQTSLLLHRDISGDLTDVFPQDIYGNYFYLRNDDGFNLSPDIVLGCEPLSLLITANINLVVVVKEANDNILAENLLKTISKFKGFKITPASINWNREQILIDEMSGRDEADILKALQNLSSQSIIRIRFRAETNFSVNNCATINPCKC